MTSMKSYLPLTAVAVIALLAVSPAQAKSSGGSSHSSSSHGSSSHAPRGSAKALPAGTHFMRKTCKTAACTAKHPSGEYMLPIKPKKGGAA
jgi:hypothetical protein